jgi:hypothetical protein
MTKLNTTPINSKQEYPTNKEAIASGSYIDATGDADTTGLEDMLDPSVPTVPWVPIVLPPNA